MSEVKEIKTQSLGIIHNNIDKICDDVITSDLLISCLTKEITISEFIILLCIEEYY
jgi:hypothetical protein